MKSLVIFERAMYSHRSSYCGRKIPKGVSVRASAHFYDDLVNSAALRPSL